MISINFIGDWKAVISGTLPNNTIWWLSTDNQKIWIESKDLEQDKFKQKGYNIAHGRIFHANKDLGELATSRLDRRRGQAAWIIKLQAILDVYPELTEEIHRKEIEEKKKKKIKLIISKKDAISKTYKQETREFIKEESIKEPKKEYFDINRGYVTWIKEEIDKNGEITISYKSLKEKMGEEFLNMHDIRIFLGLKKILPNIGISIESRSLKSGNIVTMKKDNASQLS